mgnify:CR=1 FL=1
MTTIYLIRHSAPFAQIDNYTNYKDVLWKEYNKNMILSPLGEEKAKELCNIEELNNINEVYSSNSSRAIETAKYFAESNNVKIKLDDRIKEREFGVLYLKDLPNDFNKLSFDDKTYKIGDGESLDDVDNRFKSFISELLDKNIDRVIIVMHGIILLSYLESICDYFDFDGKRFYIKYKDNIVLDGTPSNPSVYKIEFNNKNVINVSYVK